MRFRFRTLAKAFCAISTLYRRFPSRVLIADLGKSTKKGFTYTLAAIHIGAETMETFGEFAIITCVILSAEFFIFPCEGKR